MQLIGRAFDEAGLVRIGAAFQRATDYHQQGTQSCMSNLVEIRDLNIRFTGERTVHAVNDISLSLGEGEVLGLLGESGSGKSVTLRALMRLLPKKRTQISGTCEGSGPRRAGDERRRAFGVSRPDRLHDFPGARAGARSRLHDRPPDRGKRDAPRRQEPEGGDGARAGNAGGGADSLRQAPARGLSARNERRHAAARDDRAGAGLQAENPAGRRADHGAGRHRADPDPAAAARIAARVRHVRDFRDPRHRRRHRNLRPCRRHVCRPDRGAGQLRDIVRTPVHPYAKGLLASTVHGAKRGQRLETIPGTPPSLDKAPASCSFAPRCSYAQPRCTERLPPNVQVSADRMARCVLAEPADASRPAAS